MKCPNCLNNLNAKFAYCPYCRKRLPTLPTATIKEANSFHFEEQNQPRILRGALQIFLLICCVIALAVVINFISSDEPKPVVSSTDKTAPVPEAAASNAVVASEILPSAIAAPLGVVPQAKAHPQPQTITILSSSIVAAAQAGSPRPEVAAKTVPVLTATKAVVLNNAADFLPRRKTQVVEHKTIKREIPPAPEMTKVNSSNSELRLEVDSSAVILQKNIGLVSINSYVPARIYIDGQFSGVTPRAVKLVAGEHHISLMAEGYREYTRKVKVDGHQQIGMVASMTKKNTTQVAGIVEQ